ncbi:ATP-grasp domain-containing protein [Acetobacterium fimetarium]|uniref:ATP-grasp domain-containing protein n=1 Tax=Acetobacterium fimetarium TaxID=52691 RepID=A0ABR6WYV2_9FIRM|nr:ATP-grasp domain-containing protein [Acetobacterium fimetarium]MBC3805618.1 ATP-grasp domain-containing protein [Acetobacterium fimetarium]
MKKILIIGAGFLQSFVIKKAKEIGYYTIAIDKNPNSLGFKYADEYGVVDIVDQQACLKFAKEKKVDGVMTAATDYGVLSTAFIAQQMNLPGIKYDTAKVVKNKYLVRHLLYEKKIDDISQYYEISDIEDLSGIIENIHYPVMVKPCDGSGSKAVKRANSKNELKDACTEAINASLIKKALIEDFIDGKEYGVDSFIYNGEVYVLGVMGKYMTSPPDYAELGHMMPSNLDIESRLREIVKNAVQVLGINFGAVNMDVLVTKENRVCIVDVGARMGGNLIGSHIIPIKTGIDYMGSIIKASVGDEIDLSVKNPQPCVATKVLALKPGKIAGLPDFNAIQEECKVVVYHHLEIGDTIRAYHNNLDGCGYVLAISEDRRKAIENVELARKLIDDGVVRVSYL